MRLKHPKMHMVLRIGYANCLRPKQHQYPRSLIGNTNLYSRSGQFDMVTTAISGY